MTSVYQCISQDISHSQQEQAYGHLILLISHRGFFFRFDRKNINSVFPEFKDNLFKRNQFDTSFS